MINLRALQRPRVSRCLVKLFLLVIAIFMSMAEVKSVRGETDGLRTINEPYFLFSIPTDMTKVAVQGIDSYVGQYENEHIQLAFDFGLYSDPLDYVSLPHLQLIKEKIDGRRARIVSFKKNDVWFTAVHFPETGKVYKGKAKLTMTAECKSEEDILIANKIFRSIRFKDAASVLK